MKSDVIKYCFLATMTLMTKLLLIVKLAITLAVSLVRISKKHVFGIILSYATTNFSAISLNMTDL